VHYILAVLALLGLGQGELPRVAHNRLDVLHDLLEGLGRKLGSKREGKGERLDDKSGVVERASVEKSNQALTYHVWVVHKLQNILLWIKRKGG
jgi:hypothetical protein